MGKMGAGELNYSSDIDLIVFYELDANSLAETIEPGPFFVRIAQGLYDGYMRYLEGTSVEDLTSTATIRVLEPPFIDTKRQIDYRFASIALALALLLAAIEFYRLRPPVTDRVIIRETYA